MDVTARKRPCRIIVLGSNRARLNKVVAAIEEIEGSSCREDVDIEYLPCVPVLDQYEDADGKLVRYLVRVDYYPVGSNENRPSSLLSFFDEEEASEGGQFPAARRQLFSGIAAAAAGSGVHDDGDIAKIAAFLETMCKKRINVESIKPNPEYSTMVEELAAFKEMSADAKEEVTKQGIMGPGKMAQFVVELARRTIDDSLEERRLLEAPVVLPESTETDPVVEEEHAIDPDKKGYACRKCRTLLFGEANLENPPHIPSKHNFSSRKHGVRSSTERTCQSYFLSSALSWMGNTGDVDGKFSCPHCDTKLGAWNWSGAQCSCGTWVVPAIQVPVSRVDEVLPHAPVLPAGTVISPVLQQRYRAQTAPLQVRVHPETL